MRLTDELTVLARQGKGASRSVARGFPAPRGFRAPMGFAAPTTSSARLAARSSRHAAKYVAAAGLGAAIFGGMRSRSGRAVDKVSGRQTGMYGF